MQATQTPAPTSHDGVAPPHFVALPAEHCPHAPLAWQAGVAPPQSASPPQAWQVCDAASQSGGAPLHCAFDVQVTHAPMAVSQRGVVPLHKTELVAEHWPQAPLGSHAGAAPPQSESPPHPRQV